MHQTQRDFCESIKARFPQLFVGTHVLDVGSMDINGTNRYLFDSPASYTGIDLMEGPGVDIVCSGHKFSTLQDYDVVISTECFEHNPYWEQTFENMVTLTKPGGLVIMTCAGRGRQEHGTRMHHPGDSPGSILTFGDYYENLDLYQMGFVGKVVDESFTQWGLSYVPNDLQFWGVKK